MTLFEIKLKMLKYLMEQYPGSFSAKIFKYVEAEPGTLGISMNRWVPIDLQEIIDSLSMIKEEDECIVSRLIMMAAGYEFPEFVKNSSGHHATMIEMHYFDLKDGRKISIGFHRKPLDQRQKIHESFVLKNTWERIAFGHIQLVDVFEPRKAEYGGPLLWTASMEEEALEVAKEASKAARKIDEVYGYDRMMKTADSPEYIFGELLKEILDFLVVGGTAISSLEKEFNFFKRYDIESFVFDYLIYKTARAMGICPMRPVLEINIEDYKL